MGSYVNAGLVRHSLHKQRVARTSPGVWRTARPCPSRFRSPTLTLLVFLGCSMALRDPLNRPMRTRMSGGVAGESGRPLPLCRFPRRPFRAVYRLALDSTQSNLPPPPNLSSRPNCPVFSLSRFMSDAPRTGGILATTPPEVSPCATLQSQLLQKLPTYNFQRTSSSCYTPPPVTPLLRFACAAP